MSRPKTTRIGELLSAYENTWNGDFSEPDVVAESVTFSDPFDPDRIYSGRDTFQGYVGELHDEFVDLRVRNVDVLAGDESVLLERVASYVPREPPRDARQVDGRVERRMMSDLSLGDGRVERDEVLWVEQSTEK